MVYKILRNGGFAGGGAEEVAHLVPRADGKLPKVAKGKVSVTWVGHATTIVRLAGRTILTDPSGLRSCQAHGRGA